MKMVYVCYAALGYAVARWIFQRSQFRSWIRLHAFVPLACCKSV